MHLKGSFSGRYDVVHPTLKEYSNLKLLVTA